MFLRAVPKKNLAAQVGQSSLTTAIRPRNIHAAPRGGAANLHTRRRNQHSAVQTTRRRNRHYAVQTNNKLPLETRRHERLEPVEAQRLVAQHEHDVVDGQLDPGASVPAALMI